MLETISFFMILGKPFIMYLGIITLISFLVTASISIMNKKGINKIPFKWHPRMAILSIGLAVFHGILGVSLFI
jgi:hypothetical protein